MSAYEWKEYYIRARRKPGSARSVPPLMTESERVKQYLTSDNHWTDIVEVVVEEFPFDQEVLL